jgi:hypothetical protein
MSYNVTKDGIEVKPGQRWRDLDKRMRGRVITVIEVRSGFAHFHHARKGRISIHRMHNHSTGWELVK